MAETNKWVKRDRGAFWVLGETQLDEAGAVVESGGEVVKEIEGRLIEKDKISFNGQLVGRYKIETPAGITVGILGSTILDEYFNDKENPVEVGMDVRVVYTHTVKSKSGRPIKQFDFFTA